MFLNAENLKPGNLIKCYGYASLVIIVRPRLTGAMIHLLVGTGQLILSLGRSGWSLDEKRCD